MGRAVLLIVISSISIYTVITLNVNNSLNDSMETSYSYYSDNQSRNIANSLAQVLVSRLADSSDFRINTTSQSLFGGTAQYSVIDTNISGADYIRIYVQSQFNNIRKEVSILAIPPDGGIVPPTVKAAITTNNNVKTLGTVEVDGRNHDIYGNLIAVSGTYGIWTTQSFIRSGSSELGATSGGIDYVPGRVENNNVRLESQVYAGGYPDTPDSILGGTANGFPSGTLKSIAMSGVKGSQYVTNPASLSYPLQGITYVEMSTSTSGNSNEWNANNIQGSGILIVHNSALNAQIKNMNSGTFTGLIIADDIVRIHTDIIGAVIGISPAPTSGNCIGNGSGRILYSSDAIEKATGIVMGSTADGYGFSKARLEIYEWYE